VPPISPTFGSLSSWQLALLRGLGARADGAAPDARAEWLWTNLPGSWGVFLVLALLAAGLYAIAALYRREIATCPSRIKTLLVSLRCGVMLLIAIILLNPALVFVNTRSLPATIVIARDDSRSMATADRDLNEPTTARSQPTRVQVVNRLFSPANAEFLRELQRKGQLAAIHFADQAQLVELSQSASTSPQLPPLAATAGGTNLAAAIEQGLKAERPAAVLLFTDGQHTAKDDVFAAARRAGLRGIPIFPVGIGDPSRPRVQRVAKVFARPQAWQDEPFEIDVVVNFQSAEAGTQPAVLFEQPLDNNNQPVGEARLVATSQVTAPTGGSGQSTIHFSRSVSAPGRYLYRARLESPTTSAPDTAEISETASDPVNVLSRQSIRVLLIAGSPTWDYRLLQTLFTRDKTIALSCWLQSLDEGRSQEGQHPITHLPQTRAELFAYDVVLLLDPNPAEFDAAWIDLLSDFVGEHAGGLLFMAGPQYSGELLTNPRTAALAKLLPVKFGDLAALEIVSLVSATQQAWPLHLVAANADHPVLRFYPDTDESIRRWQALPGVFWSFPAAEPVPTALVLAEHADPALRSTHGPRPLLAAGRFGSGNTLYLGFTGTWRWRSAGRQAEFFDKFWIQAVRFLVEGRSQESRRRGYVQTDRERYEIGDRVTLSARLQDAAFEPLTQPEIDATLLTSDSATEKIRLVAIANQPGRYEAAFTASKLGQSTLRVQLPGGSTDDSIETSFQVELPSLETSQTWLNRPLLQDIAKLSGGKYFAIDEMAELAASVPNRTETIEERSRPLPLWDVPAMLVLLVGLLSTEWLLRRRYNLL